MVELYKALPYLFIILVFAAGLLFLTMHRYEADTPIQTSAAGLVAVTVIGSAFINGIDELTSATVYVFVADIVYLVIGVVIHHRHMNNVTKMEIERIKENPEGQTGLISVYGYKSLMNIEYFDSETHQQYIDWLVDRVKWRDNAKVFIEWPFELMKGNVQWKRS